MEKDFEIGKVIEVQDGFAKVELADTEGCHTCGARLICHPQSSGKRILRLKNSLHAPIGSKVQIEQSDKRQLILGLMQSGLPTAGFVIGVVGTNQRITHPIHGIPADLIQFGIGLIVLIITGLIVRLWCKSRAAKGFAVFTMKEIC